MACDQLMRTGIAVRPRAIVLPLKTGRHHGSAKSKAREAFQQHRDPSLDARRCGVETENSGAGRRARHGCERTTSCLNDGHNGGYGGPPHY